MTAGHRQECRNAIATALLSGAFFLWMAGVSRAQEHFHPPQDAGIHTHFYSNWMRPDHPNLSCCNKIDCYPTKARFRSGQWQAQRREDGAWLTVPPEKVELNRDSPDTRSHMCAPPPGRGDVPYCFIAGGGI